MEGWKRAKQLPKEGVQSGRWRGRFGGRGGKGPLRTPAYAPYTLRVPCTSRPGTHQPDTGPAYARVRLWEGPPNRPGKGGWVGGWRGGEVGTASNRVQYRAHQTAQACPPRPGRHARMLYAWVEGSICPIKDTFPHPLQPPPKAKNTGGRGGKGPLRTPAYAPYTLRVPCTSRPGTRQPDTGPAYALVRLWEGPPNRPGKGGWVGGGVIGQDQYTGVEPIRPSTHATPVPAGAGWTRNQPLECRWRGGNGPNSPPKKASNQVGGGAGWVGGGAKDPSVHRRTLRTHCAYLVLVALAPASPTPGRRTPWYGCGRGRQIDLGKVGGWVGGGVGRWAPHRIGCGTGLTKRPRRVLLDQADTPVCSMHGWRGPFAQSRTHSPTHSNPPQKRKIRVGGGAKDPPFLSPPPPPTSPNPKSAHLA